jgi:DNA-binding MarR family transcriptional regulator
MWCDDNLIFLLGCTQRAVRARLMEHLAPLGVSYETFQTLVGLAVGDGIAQHELAARLCLEPTYTTRMLTDAEELNLVKRDRDEDDARVLRVQLTPSGQALWQELNALHEHFRVEALACLSANEQEELQRLLATLRNHVKALPAIGQGQPDSLP